MRPSDKPTETQRPSGQNVTTFGLARPTLRWLLSTRTASKRIDAQEITRDRVSNFIQTWVGQPAHPSPIMEGAMHDSQRYRDSAAECLLAAEEACQPYYRKLHLSMAASWLSLARQDEAIDNLFASWDTDKPIREPAIGRH
jgi:hypothetical protein